MDAGFGEMSLRTGRNRMGIRPRRLQGRYPKTHEGG